MRYLLTTSLLFVCLAILIGFQPNTTTTAQANDRTASVCTNGTASGYPCSNVNLLSRMTLNDFGANDGTDLWGWTDSRDGREYVMMGVDIGTAFVDVTNPIRPIYLGMLPTQTNASDWRDIKVHSDHAYIGSEAFRHGVQVFDLRQLRDVATPPITFSTTAHLNTLGSSHNIVSNEDSDYVYAVGTRNNSGSFVCGGGLYVIDVSTPTAPSFAGCFSADGYTHDAQCVIYNGPDTTHVGKEICFASNTDSVTIVDMTDKSAPVLLSKTAPYPGLEYTHQGWLTEDHATFATNDEFDERDGNEPFTRTFIWDVSDLDNVPAPAIYTGAAGNIDHNLYIKGDRMYQANYRAGLRIFDSSDIANGNITEIGYFDTYPANDNPNFNSAWTGFPYFDSGLVAISDIEQGLMLVRPTFEADFRLAVTPSRLTRCGDEPLSVQLETEAIANFSSSIDVSAETIPLALAPTQASMPPNGSQTLQLSSSGIVSGTYAIGVTGTTPTKTYTTTLLVHQLAAPVGTAPTLDQVGVALQPTFMWQGESGSNYRLEVATDAAFTNLVIDTSVTGTSYQPAVSLSIDTTYFWRLSAESGPCAETVAYEGRFTTAGSPTRVALTTTQLGASPMLFVLGSATLLLLVISLSVRSRSRFQ